jgi:hypothetical protein
MPRPSRFAVVLALWAGSLLPMLAQTPPDALSLAQTLHANILASSSATLSLEAWCRDRRMAEDPRIVARVLKNVRKAPSAEQLLRLQVASPDHVKYRRVELRCGTHLFSEADNWYVPGRLTTEMNLALDTTEAPFGRVVQPLRPYRRTFGVVRLWAPDNLFEHRAVLHTGEHLPFSEVHEVYKGGLLAGR